VIFLNYFGKKNLKEGGGVILGVMAEKERRTRRWDVTNKSRVGKGNQSANSGGGPFSGYIDEAKDLLSKKSTWIDAAHQGVNSVLEKGAKMGRMSRGGFTKALGAPAELAKIAGKSAWILSSKERREENKKDFEKQSKTSVVNRALSGYTNTAGNLVGMGQALYDVNNSLDDAALSELRGTPGYYSSRRDLDPLKDHTVNPWKNIKGVNREAMESMQESEAYWKEKESEDAFGFSSDVFDDAAAKKAFGGDEKKRKEQLMQFGVRDESMDEWSPPTIDFSESSTAEDKGGDGKRPDGDEKEDFALEMETKDIIKKVLSRGKEQP
jgi:hypothetical protein